MGFSIPVGTEYRPIRSPRCSTGYQLQSTPDMQLICILAVIVFNVVVLKPVAPRPQPCRRELLATRAKRQFLLFGHCGQLSLRDVKWLW